jgi:hypothetical protein
MSDNMIIELRNALKNFLTTASDDEFCQLLAEADQGVYSKIDVPVAILHKNISYVIGTITYCNYSVTARADTALHLDKTLNAVALSEPVSLSVNDPLLKGESLTLSNSNSYLNDCNAKQVNIRPELPLAA